MTRTATQQGWPTQITPSSWPDGVNVMQLPEPVYQTLVAVCASYPWPVVQQDAHLGEILNEVAYRHRAEGWGLSQKRFGRHVQSPAGPVAEDILQLPNGHHFDVLGGAGVGLPLQPRRATSIGIIDLASRPWVAPVAHTLSWASTPPVPVDPPDTVPTTPDTPPGVDTARILDALAALDAQIVSLRETQAREFEALLEWLGTQVVAIHLDDIKQRIDAVRARVDGLPQQGCRLRL